MHAFAHRNFTRANLRRLLLLLFALSGAPFASAVIYCVDTSSELNSALIAAGASATDDEIRL